MKLNKRTVGIGVTLVLAVLAYFFGPDVVTMVKDQVQVAPVTSESTE